MAKMYDDTLAGIVKNRIDDSLGLNGDQLSEDRINALKYYRGDPFGNEREGRSQVVSRDVAEAIDGVLPGLIKIFTSGDEVVRFDPRGPEDEQQAKQATDYVNWVVNQQNEGFRLFYTWFKDALLQKTGILKVWWDDAEQITKEKYEGLTQEQLMMLQADEDIEIEEQEVMQAPLMGSTAMTPPQTVPMFNVTVRKTNKDGHVCIEAVPPEEFLIERWAVGLDDSLFCGHRFRRTVSWWIEQGFDPEIVRKAAGTGMGDFAGERAERFIDEGSTLSGDQSSGMDDESTTYMWGAECYLKVDYDGDGIAELRKVTVAGDSAYEILDNEEIDEYPFAALSPILMPHKFHGMSVADQVMDLQLLKSTLWRQMLDNLYLSNEPQRIVQADKVNLDDLLSGGPGRAIRVTGDVNNTIREVSVPFVAKETFPMMEYIDGMREQRTGITRYSQGLDANSLNKTATGINIIQSAAQQRQELIARVFAETGVKRLFKLVLGFVSKYQQKPQMIRLRNEWVPMDPRNWKTSYDMTVNVGLGTGNKQEQVATLTNLINLANTVVAQQQGINGPLVTGQNLYHMFSKLVEASGLKSPEMYFTDPATQQPQQPKPSPVEQKAQSDMQIAQQQAQLNAQTKQQDSQLQAQLDTTKAQHEIEIMRMKAMAQIEIDRQKAAAQMEIEKMKAATQAEMQSQQMQNDNARADFHAQRDAARADAQTQASPA